MTNKRRKNQQNKQTAAAASTSGGHTHDLAPAWDTVDVKNTRPQTQPGLSLVTASRVRPSLRQTGIKVWHASLRDGDRVQTMRVDRVAALIPSRGRYTQIAELSARSAQLSRIYPEQQASTPCYAPSVVAGAGLPAGAIS